jgi:homogentisate 1,2-dioxygenase
MIEYQSGFGNTFSTEAEEGALPRTQNTPRKTPYGLFPEQINGTCFTVPAAHNRRTWMYRIRPSVGESPYEAKAHPGIDLSYLDARPQPNLLGWKPVPLDAEGDFVDGLTLVGGAGDPAELRGMAAYVYAANQDMKDRSFHSADGDLLILPDTGGLTIRTECGVLEVDPGQIAIIPRGIKLAVSRRGADVVRGYVGETYGRHFELPARGVIGANSLADARHFEAPVASYEDRPNATHRITAKVGGVIYEATRPGSPFDVVAWHGNYTPYRYDLSHFSPVGSVDVDHADPSIFIVLTSPMDHPGENSLDLVIFPPRWDVARHTFRPPFWHRQAATELNGIVTGPTGDRVFARGGLFLTPPFSGHGVRKETVDRILDLDDDAADAPERISEGSLWMQFETCLPFRVRPAFLDAAHRDPSYGDNPRSVEPRFSK